MVDKGKCIKGGEPFSEENGFQEGSEGQGSRVRQYCQPKSSKILCKTPK